MIFCLTSWPWVTLKGQIEVKLQKRARNLFFAFSKSLIFSLKWLLGLLGHYSWRQKFVLDFFPPKICVIYFILHSRVVQDYKYAYILETIYLRHKVTIYDLYKLIYELWFGIMSFDLEWSWKVKSRSNLFFTFSK